MSTKIAHNMAALSTINLLAANDKNTRKAMGVLASGEMLNSAGDGAAEYSISKRMDVKLRALEQDSRNVENGASMLRVAEYAIQNQIELMKTVKARVIQAHNDTNTDEDRAIIEKEIFQYYDEIEDIAVETTYNGRQLLYGGESVAKVFSWKVLDAPVLVDDSSLDIIPDDYADLDNTGNGPYAIYIDPYDPSSPYYTGSTVSRSAIAPLGIPTASSAIRYYGGQPGTGAVLSYTLPSTVSTNFSTFKATMNTVTGGGTGTGYGIQVNRNGIPWQMLLTTHPSDDVNAWPDWTLDLTSCNSWNDVVTLMNNNSSRTLGATWSVATSSGSVVFTLSSSDTSSTSATSGLSISGWSSAGSSGTHTGSTPAVSHRAGAARTNAGFPLSRGANDQYPVPGDLDGRIIYGNAASINTSLAGAAAGSGFIVTVPTGTYSSQNRQYYFMIDNGNAGPTQDSEGIWHVGRDWNGSFTLNGYNYTYYNSYYGRNVTDDRNVSFSMDGNGNLTIKGKSNGSWGDRISVTDGYAERLARPSQPTSTPYSYANVVALSGTQRTETAATQPTYAYADIDLDATGYARSTNLGILEDFIQQTARPPTPRPISNVWQIPPSSILMLCGRWWRAA